MKILIISAALYPDNSPRSFRTTELAMEFARQNHEVTVLIPGIYEKRIEFGEKNNFQINDPCPEITEKFRSRYFDSPILARYGNRLLEWIFEFPDIQYKSWVQHGLHQYKGFDLMISVAAPHAIHWGVASYLEKGNHNPASVWIADCGDPFMGAKMNRLPKMPWFSKYEKSFCRQCDFITVPIPSAISAYYAEFRDKIRVIPQGFQFEESKKYLKQYQKHHKPTFAYAGSLSPIKRDPRPLMDYLISQDKDYHFILYTNAQNLVAGYDKRSDGKIDIRPYIPRNELLSTLSTMDFLINFENEVKEQVPSKLIDYYLINRPVLSISYHDQVENKIEPFLNGDYGRALHFKDVDHYKIENVCQQFIQLHHDVVETK